MRAMSRVFSGMAEMGSALRKKEGAHRGIRYYHGFGAAPVQSLRVLCGACDTQ